jgi:hypothetical protein
MAGVLRFCCIATVAAFAAGCAPEFDRVSEIETLRILAVQKDVPYARPGETVNLSMLWRDGSDKAGRQVEVNWLSWCFNPPGDLFFSCFANVDPTTITITAEKSVCPLARDRWVRRPNSGVDDALAQPTSGAGRAANPQCDSTFSFQMPSDILDRPRPSDPTQPHYGLAYVFFAVCAGTLSPEQGQNERDFPFVCRDEQGNRLGPDDFVAGYTAVYAFEPLPDDGTGKPESEREIRNNNPPTLGFLLDEVEASERCIGDECRDLRDRWGNFDCDRSPTQCVPSCEDDGDESCPPHKIRPLLAEGFAEEDVVSNATRGRSITEQMWINYYAERGGVKSEVRLLNDAFTGVNRDYGTEFYAPKESGMTVVWAVVHDNRGGTSWVGMPIWVKAPEATP